MSNNRGERNRLLVIEKRVDGADAANQPLDEWEFVMQRWGKPLTSSGMASVRAAEQGVIAAPTAYSWRINYTPQGIDTGMRATYKGMHFDIRQIKHDIADREHTDLVCELGGNDG